MSFLYIKIPQIFFCKTGFGRSIDILFCMKEKEKKETMIRKAKNFPSSITKDNAFGGERGGAIEMIDDSTTFFTNDVKDILKNLGVVNDEDINAMMKKTTDLFNKKI